MTLGVITGSLFRSSYFDALKSMLDDYFNNIENRQLYLGTEESFQLLVRVMFRRLRPFVLLWLLSGTNYVRIFIAWLFAARGYMSGFMVCFLVMAYGGGSVPVIFAWGMPQVLLYGVAYVMSMIYILSDFSRKKSIIITLLSLLMIAGCICEAYVNPAFLGMAV